MTGNFDGDAESTEKNCARQAEKLFAAFCTFQKIPGAWEEWRSYRKQVTDYIIENSQQGTSLAIFGAGRLNDLSLPRLVKHFSQVTLFDIDEEAMWEAVRRDGVFSQGNFQTEISGQQLSMMKDASFPQGKKSRQFWEEKKNFVGNNQKGCLEGMPEIPSGLNIFPVDFVGIAQEDYFSFAKTLLYVMEGHGFCGAVHAASEQLSRMYEKSRVYVPKLPQENYDYTVALGIHSQLGNLPAWLLNAVKAQVLGRAKDDCEKEPCHKKQPTSKAESWQKITAGLLARMERENTFLSMRLNELILSATKRKAFIGCEVSRAVCENGEWYAVPDSAVSGAWQAIEDVKRRAAGGEIHFENYLDIVWPFFLAQGKAYRMMVMEVKGKE